MTPSIEAKKPAAKKPKYVWAIGVRPSQNRTDVQSAFSVRQMCIHFHSAWTAL